MGRAVEYLRMTAFRKGVAGSSRTWFGLWLGITVARRVRRWLHRDEQVVERIVLHPGQVVEIRDTGVAREVFTG
jgi:hypothetical protein